MPEESFTRKKDTAEKPVNGDEILGLWIAMGAALGIVFGLLFDQPVWGMIMGPGLGVAVGAALIEQAKAKADAKAKNAKAGAAGEDVSS